MQPGARILRNTLREKEVFKRRSKGFQMSSRYPIDKSMRTAKAISNKSKSLSSELMALTKPKSFLTKRKTSAYYLPHMTIMY